MAEESEKRLHAIMDKLFHAPPKSKSKSSTTNSTSLSGAQLSRGKKRPNTASALAVLEAKSRGDVVEELQNNPTVAGGSVQAPLCRPWDRGDLLRRLATFKSMTWFAKPKARLMFSTPSSWTQQQVEKAALVFSLKLDNGHKLLCPWVDNACDELLAEFPHTPAAGLVEDYNKRCSVLLQLLALPVISSSAIDYMRSPQLEYFLQGSSTMKSANESSADTSRTEYIGGECEAVFSVLYYQAQKLISLCGWEPRSLPYIVDCNDRQDQTTKDGNLSDLSHVVSNGKNRRIGVCSSGTDESTETNDNAIAGKVQSDPNSVVLDCRLCGASVGLWAFTMVPQPVEFFRLVGFSEVNGENDAAHNKENVAHCDAGVHGESREGIVSAATIGATPSNDRPLNLNLTIGGGPPPTKQNFRATISLPLIGRNLRAWFSSDSSFRDHVSVKSSFQDDKDRTGIDHTQHGFQPEDVGLLQGKGHDDGRCNSTSGNQLTCLNIDISEQGNTLRNENSSFMSLEGADISGQEIPETSMPDSVMENPLENTLIVAHGSILNEKLPESSENERTDNPVVGDLCSSQVGDSSIINLDGHGTIENSETSEDGTSRMVAGHICNLQQNPGSDSVCNKEGDSQDGSGVEARVLPVNNNSLYSCKGEDLKQLPCDKGMEFDPIRQHRHFCPWIASSSNSAPGWKQTLSALQRQKESSYPLAKSASSSSSMIEVDDPIASVKKLFTSPSAKRMKHARGSS